MKLLTDRAVELIANSNNPEYRIHVTNFAIKLFTFYLRNFNEQEFLKNIDNLRSYNKL